MLRKWRIEMDAKRSELPDFWNLDPDDGLDSCGLKMIILKSTVATSVPLLMQAPQLPTQDP
jgi:hypothetical protein